MPETKLNTFKPFDPAQITETQGRSNTTLKDPTVKELSDLVNSYAVASLTHRAYINEYAGKSVYSDLVAAFRKFAHKSGIKCGTCTVKYKGTAASTMFLVMRVKKSGLIFIDPNNLGVYDLDGLIGKKRKARASDIFVMPAKLHYMDAAGKKREIRSVSIAW